MLVSLALLSLTSAQGCYDDGDGRFNARMENYIALQNRGNNMLHRRAQSGTYSPKVPHSKFRDLEWGDLNVVHVTDTHGWLSGHLNNQDQYSADWGDFISFSEHLNAEAERRGVDLLYVETGDRHDGTGLSDATHVDAQLSNQVFAQQPFDILSIGNHELYSSAVTDQEFNVIRPFYKDSYLSGNVDIWRNNSWVPAGNKYKIFETKNKKIRILAFSFLFNFKGNANNSRVTQVEKAVQEEWFQEAVNRTDYDLIFVTGHIPVRGFKEFDAVVNAIRKVNPQVPIQGFGGHSHVRDFRRFDDNAVALESGRYLETIGWAGLNLTSHPTSSNVTASFSRRYIDFNPENLAYHTNTEIGKNFTTLRGAAVSQQIANLRANLSLDATYGTVDKDYQINWAKFNSSSSIFTLLSKKIYPLLKSNITTENGVSRDQLPRIIIGNTGNYRYPLLKGKFTKDQKYIVSPFSDAWIVATDVPKDLAFSVLPHLNNDYPFIKKREVSSSVITTSPEVEIFSSAPAATETYTPELRKSKHKNMGYVTHDDFGHDGDDVIHTPYKVYKLPNAFQAQQNITKSTTTVDIVFSKFIQKDVVPFIQARGWNGTVAVYSSMYDRDVIESYFTSKSN